TTLSLPEIASREIASLSETRPYTTQELLALPKGHLLNFDEVAAYVHESTRGIVKTSELGKTKGKSFQFLVDTKRQVIANSRPEVPDTIQDLFDFDLDRFISDSGLPDFASAKRAYYD